MDKIKRIGFVIACCILNMAAMAQTNSPAEDPNDFMRSNGKIYVVVACAVLIITGLFIYLLSLDKKIKKLEKEYK